MYGSLALEGNSIMDKTTVKIINLTREELTNIVQVGLRQKGLIPDSIDEVNVNYIIGTEGDGYYGGYEDPGYDVVESVEVRWTE